MAFDYKKEYKDLYQPKRMPAIVTVPAMRFVAVETGRFSMRKSARCPLKPVVW